MEKINYYKDYTEGKISLTDGYAKVTEILLMIFEVYEEAETLDDALLITQFELDDDKDIREFYEDQQDLFAHRIAHNFMLANDYTYASDGSYQKLGPTSLN